MRSLSFACVVLLAALTGCEQVEPNKPAPSDDTPASKVGIKPEEPAQAPMPSKSVVKVKAEPTVLALAPAELDLSLPENLSFESTEKLEEPKLLPQLLHEKTADEGYQLSGRIIHGDKGDDYWDSVEGAEITIEIRQ